MPIATGLALGLAGLSAAGALGGAAISGNAAGNAASTQSNAALQAAGLQQGDANASLQAQEQALNLSQQNSAPYRAVGQNALLANNDLLGLTPVNPYPINAGGNTAPQAAGIGGGGSPGYINGDSGLPGGYAPGVPYTAGSNADATNTPYKGAPQAPVPRAAGGPINRLAQHYIVGEKGPERLDMFPNGTGWVTPMKGNQNKLIPRADGGPIGPLTENGGSPVAMPAPGYGNPAGPQASTGGLPANHPTGTFNAQPPSPYGAQSSNPLVTGGSSQPVQNTPYSQWTQQFQAPTGAPGQFQQPTLAQAQNAPGYQFQLQQGEQALTNQASANGELGDSNYGRALTNYAEGAAQSDYNNVFNQGLSTNQQQLADYQTNYQNALGQYDQNYNIFNNNQNTQYNRLAGLAGTGQTSTNQLNATNQAGAANIGNTLLQSGAQVGQQLNNAGAATASGYIGQGNAYAGAVNGLTNAASLPLYLQMLQQNQGGQPDYSALGGV